MLMSFVTDVDDFESISSEESSLMGVVKTGKTSYGEFAFCKNQVFGQIGLSKTVQIQISLFCASVFSSLELKAHTVS